MAVIILHLYYWLKFRQVNLLAASLLCLFPWEICNRVRMFGFVGWPIRERAGLFELFGRGTNRWGAPGRAQPIRGARRAQAPNGQQTHFTRGKTLQAHTHPKAPKKLGENILDPNTRYSAHLGKKKMDSKNKRKDDNCPEKIVEIQPITSHSAFATVLPKFWRKFGQGSNDLPGCVR